MSLNLSLCYYSVVVVSAEHQIPLKTFIHPYDEHIYLPKQCAFVLGIMETHNIDFHLF